MVLLTPGGGFAGILFGSKETTLLERMFRIHLRDVSTFLIHWFGSISIAFIVPTRPFDYRVPQYQTDLLYWRITVCLFLVLPMIALGIPRRLRRWLKPPPTHCTWPRERGATGL